MTWRLAIDFGTTTTAAAIHQGESELIQIEGMSRLPSLVMLGADGAPVVGAAADRQAAGAPERVERTPKRRLGDRILLLGGQAVDPVELVAAVLRLVAVEARRLQGGSDPAEVVLTHPVSWAGHRLAALREAARRADLGEVILLPEPVAAAMHLADDRIGAGDHVAVYDLGGGTFDCAVLRRTATGFEPVGVPGGDQRLGGEHFDELLYDTVGRTLAVRNPDLWEQLRNSEERMWVRANIGLRHEVRLAKEALATTSEYVIYAGSPVDQEIRITREELERLLRAPLERTVDELLATIERAGLVPADIKAVYLAGGSSRMPLVTQLLSERTALVPFTWGDPKAAVALGAASWAGRSESPVMLAAPTNITPGVPTIAASAKGDPLTDPLPVAARRPRRRPAVLTGLGLIVAVLAGVLVASQTGGGADPKPPPEKAEQHTFPPVELDGLLSMRTWSFDPAKDRLLTNVVKVRNMTEGRTVGVFEVVPKELAEDVADLSFDPAPTEVVEADPVVRYDLVLAAGEERTLTWTVVVTDRVDQTSLKKLARQRDEADRRFREGLVDPTTTSTESSTTTTGTGKPPPTTTTTRVDPTTTTGTGPTTSTSTPTSTSTSTPTTSTTVVRATAPQMVGAFRTANPQGSEPRADNEYTKVTVTLSWAPPGDNGGAPVTGYRLRCTTMAGSQVYTGPASGSCGNGVQIATPSATATSTSVTISRLDPENSWIRWEIAAVNSAGTGPYRTTEVVVPNLVGQPTWHAFQHARIVGLNAEGDPSTACPAEQICAQSLAAGSVVGNGALFVLYQH